MAMVILHDVYSIVMYVEGYGSRVETEWLFSVLSLFFSGSVVLFGRCFKGKIEAGGGLTDLNIDRGKGGGAEGEGEGDGGATVYFFC